jgi:hypothetical protein
LAIALFLGSVREILHFHASSTTSEAATDPTAMSMDRPISLTDDHPYAPFENSAVTAVRPQCARNKNVGGGTIAARLTGDARQQSVERPFRLLAKLM